MVAQAIENLPKLKGYIIDYCEKFPELSAEEMAEDLGFITSEILVFWAGGWTRIISKTPAAVSKIGKAACKAMKWPWKNHTVTVTELISGGGKCKMHAEKIKQIIGGDIIKIKDKLGAPAIGAVYTKEGNLISNICLEHLAVKKGDFIYDRITGPSGMKLAEYKKLFQNGEYLDFSNVIP